MSPTDTSEKGLETLIVESLVNEAGYVQGSNEDYSRGHVIDLAMLRMFLEATQPEMVEDLALDQDCPKRTQFLHRLDAEIAKRGVIDVLRKGGSITCFWIRKNQVQMMPLVGIPSQASDVSKTSEAWGFWASELRFANRPSAPNPG